MDETEKFLEAAGFARFELEKRTANNNAANPFFATVAGLNAAVPDGKVVQLLLPLDCFHGQDEDENNQPMLKHHHHITNVDAAIRKYISKLEEFVTPKPECLSDETCEDTRSAVIHVSPHLYFSNTESILARIVLPDHALPSLKSLQQQDMSDQRPLVPALLVTIRSRHCEKVYVWAVKFRNYASASMSLNAKWWESVQTVTPTNDWLYPQQPVIQRVHEFDADGADDVAAAATSITSLSGVLPPPPASISPPPSLDEPNVALNVDTSNTDSFSTTNLLSAHTYVQCKCENILSGSNCPPEQQGIEYKAVVDGRERIYVEACVKHITDNILPMMRSGSIGSISVGVSDDRLPTLFQLPDDDGNEMAAKEFVAQIAVRVERFLAGVFPRFSADAKFVLCLKEVKAPPTPRRFALQFYFNLSSQSHLRQALLHPRFNWAPQLLFHFGADRTHAVARSLTPVDIWMRARESAISLPHKVVRQNPLYSKLAILQNEHKTPSDLISIPALRVHSERDPISDSQAISTAAAATTTLAGWVQNLVDSNADDPWLVFACCRNAEEARFTLRALHELSGSALSIQLVVLLDRYNDVSYDSEMLAPYPQPLLPFLASLKIFKKWALLDIFNPTATASVLPTSQEPVEDLIAAGRGVFTRLLADDVELSEVEVIEQARAWIEKSVPLPWAVHNAGLAVHPQVAALVEAVQRACSGATVLQLCKQSNLQGATFFHSRGVGATTLLRATAFTVLKQLPNTVVLELSSNVDTAQAFSLLKSIAQKRLLLVLDDELPTSLALVKMLEADEQRNYHLVYLRVSQVNNSSSAISAISVQSHFKSDISALCAALSRIYPAAAAPIAAVQTKFLDTNEPVHFLLIVLTALLGQPITALENIVKNVLDTVSKESRICNTLIALSFLCCFGQDNCMWIQRSKLERVIEPDKLKALISQQHILRVRNSRVVSTLCLRWRCCSKGRQAAVALFFSTRSSFRLKRRFGSFLLSRMLSTPNISATSSQICSLIAAMVRSFRHW